MFFKEYREHQKIRRKEEEQILEGYKTTKTPVLPYIMQYAASYGKVEDKNGNSVVRLIFAEFGSRMVHPECIDMISKTLKDSVYCSNLFRKFKYPLPGNLISITVAFDSFILGDDYQEFMLDPKYQTSKKAVFTHRKLSECLQYTYYNENGIEFQAGYTYYPAPNGTPKLLSENELVMRYADYGAVPYPLQDRRKTKNYIANKYYGRFCERVGRMVVVGFRREEPYHLQLVIDDPMVEGCSKCAECAEEFYKYQWKEPIPEKTSPFAPSTSPARALTVLQIFQSAGINFNSLVKLRSLPEDTLIPMVNKTTKEALPESQLPKAKDLLLSIMLNSEYSIDPNFDIGPNSDTRVFLDPSNTRFAKWLMANPGHEIPCKTNLMNQLILENLTISNQTKREIENNNFYQESDASLSLLGDANDADNVQDEDEVNDDVDVHCELVQ